MADDSNKSLGNSNDGKMDLPAEMFRTSDQTNNMILKIPRVNLGFIGQNAEIRYSEINGLAIFEGDILLGTVEQMREAMSRPDDKGLTIEGDKFRWGTFVNGRITQVTVPYVAEDRLVQIVKDATAHWEQHTPIRFVKRTTEEDFISFESLDGCFSNIGRQGKKQVISLGGGCGLGSAIHEIGHSLGLFHEQCREDRDDHVVVLNNNINPNARHNFEKHIQDATDQGSYDFGSIMHYPAKAFSVNGKDTIQTKGGQTIGQRNGLSSGDIAAIKKIYPDLAWPA